VVVHKARDGSYRLLLNGCESQAGADGYHTLPSFRTDETIHEDATGREVPAPVVVSVLVEDGACAPNSAVLQIKQRTYVAGVQTNEGREPMVNEAWLRTTLPGSARSLARAVAYPMAFGLLLEVTFVDNSRARAAALKEQQQWTSMLIRSAATLRNRFSAKAVGKMLMDHWGKAVFVAGAYFLQDISGALTVLGNAYFNLVMNAATVAGAVLNWRDYGSWVLKGLTVAGGMWHARDLKAQIDEKNKPRDVTVSLFDLPAILKRVAGSTSGGVYSNLGAGWTFEDLKRAKRTDDIAVMEYILFNTPDGTDEDRLRDIIVDATVDSYYEVAKRGQPATFDPPRITDVQKADLRKETDDLITLFKKARVDQKNANAMRFDASSVQDIKAGGFVEATLNVEVVDTRRNGNASRETFRMASKQSFAAGALAVGYARLKRELDETMKGIVANFEGNSNLITVPLVQLWRKAKITGNPVEDLANWWVSRNKDVALPSEKEMLVPLAMIVKGAQDALDELLSSANAAIPSTPLDRSTPVVRYLPHVVRIKNAGAASFAIGTEDRNIAIAEEGGPAAVSSTVLQDAVAAAREAGSVVRQAVAQFVEREGVAQPRMRTQLLMGARRFDPAGDGLAPIVDQDRRERRLDTRHVYAPRMPLPVVDAMACRAEHAQLREQLEIAWLATPLGDPKTSGIAAVFGVPVSHAGELALGVIADLATDDALERAPTGLHVSPTRAQLMASAVGRAVRRLRVAGLLAKAAFREWPLPLRLDDNDALFVCYPEGGTLLKLLRESAAWRNWQVPQAATWEDHTSAWRQDMRASMAAAAPTGIASLNELLESIERLEDAVVPLDRFPFLATQTLVTHTPDALAVLKTHNASLPKVTHRAWTGLAMQLEHAFFAAQRLHAMATGLGLDEDQRAALLRDCARARPVLGCAPTGSALDEAPASCVGLLALFTGPIAELRGPPLQPGVPSTPSAHTLLDNRLNHAVLQARTAAMRLDLEGLAGERALEVDAPLEKAFAQLRVGTSVAQYLVSFGDAAVKGHYPLMSRFFESLPVYVDLLLTSGTAPQEMLQGTIVPRLAHDPVNNLHPLVITTTAAEPLKTVRLGVALASLTQSRSDGALPPPPETLQEAHAQLRITTSGVDVDAASAFLFNVERLVQCVLLAAATSPDCTYLTAPPPSNPQRKRIDAPSPPAKPERLLLAEMRVNALSVMMSTAAGSQVVDLKAQMGYDDSGTEEGKKVEVLLAKLAYDEALYQWLESAAASAQQQPLDKSGTYGKRASERRGYFQKVQLAALGQFQDQVKAHELAWQDAWLENADRDAKEFSARCWELGAWPNVVAVANAVARSLLTDPPVLFASVPAGPCPVPTTPTALAKAVASWRAQGLAAVPLCELVAVLVSASV